MTRRSAAPATAALLASVAAAAQIPDVAPDVAREWRAREWALHPRSRAEAIARALAADEWTERHASFDALARTPRAARLGVALLSGGAPGGGAAAARILAEPHPNVRAAALEMLTAGGLALDAGGPAAAALASDPLDEVRLALVENALLSGDDPAAVELLARLAGGAGAAAELARHALLTAGPAAADAQLALLAPGGTVELEALLAAVPRLRRAPVSGELVGALRARLPERGRAAAAALVECIALHGELDGESDGSSAPPRCDRGVLVAGWLALPPSPDGTFDARSERLWSAALGGAAREGDEALGRLLFEAARELERAGDPVQGAAVLAGDGADALDVELAADLARGLSDDVAAVVWTRVAHRAERFDPERVGVWLARDRPAELRFGVASIVADAFLRTGDPGSRALLEPLLSDTDSGIRRAAFRWLCDGPDVAARLAGLHAAWRGYEPDERRLHLRSLPRDVPPLPFQGDLLALCADPEERTADVLELLGALRDDPAVAAALERWLADALQGMEGGAALDDYRAHEWRAKALVLALGREPVPVLVDALRRALASAPRLAAGEEHDPELPKTIVAQLGGTPDGRAALAQLLGDEVARRTRVEAAIQLAGRCGGAVAERVGEVLAASHGAADSELGVRVLGALGRGRDAEGRAFLAATARDPGQDLEQRVAAVTALGAREAVTELAEVVGEARQADVVLAAVQALGELDAGEAVAALRGAWRALDRRGARGAGEAHDGHLAGELLAALAATGALAPAELGAWWAEDGPLAAAAADLELRYRGGRPAATEFRWRAELAAAGHLARRGELDGALAAAGPWWRADGRLLAALAGVARAAGGDARELDLAALVALAGEPATPEGDDLRLAAAAALAQAAAGERRWEDVEAWSRRLWTASRRRGRASPAFEEAFGSFDRRAGVDPDANLASACLQAGAWSALAAGRRERAGALAEAARRRIGASSAARRAQTELEAALR